MKIASIVTIIGCCSLRSVQAQAASNSNCPEERNNPPPLNTICGQSGTLPNSASSFNVVGGLASSAADCAQQCADAYEAQCKFFAYTPPDPQCNPEDFSCGLGSCAGYSKTGKALGFKQGPNANNTKFFASSCYYTPSSCDFIVQSDAGQFLLTRANEPSVFVSNKASATRLSHSSSFGLYITQNGQKYVASVPKIDRQTQPSIVSFVSPDQLGKTATQIGCSIIRGSTFYCNVGAQYNKAQFDTCPRPNRPREVLGIEYIANDYGQNPPPSEGTCRGGDRVTLNYSNYVARR